MFLLIDTNSGGLLSQKEFIASAAILVTFGIDLDEPEAVYKQLDKDGSGSINFEEFVDYFSMISSMLLRVPNCIHFGIGFQ